MGKELWLFTMRFPFGNGEAFLESELPYLAERFGRVLVFPLLTGGSVRPLPEHVETVEIFRPEEVHRSLPLTLLGADLRRFRHLLRSGRGTAPSSAVYAKHRAEFISQARQALRREQLFHKRMAPRFDPARTALYSYWTSDWATVLGLWKLRDPRVRFVSRMMGFDLFDHRAPDGWQRFQRFHVEQAAQVFVISQAGLDHIHARYPALHDRFSLSYLATADHGPAPWQPAEELRIVSCANLVELKRVGLIAQALHQVHGPVHWTHFGDGPERERLERAVATLPARMQVQLMGSRPNAEVIAWYRANPVDLFVHASRTEGGAPVALQEAASFGIPLLAADAGGVREVVTGESGILLPNALTPELLADALNAHKASGRNAHEARARVRAFWAARFDAATVHARFAEILASDLFTAGLPAGGR